MGNVKSSLKITGIQNHLTKQSWNTKNLTLEVEYDQRIETCHNGLDLQRGGSSWEGGAARRSSM